MNPFRNVLAKADCGPYIDFTTASKPSGGSMKKMLLALALAVSSLSAPAIASDWKLDVDHLTVGFSVKHEPARQL
jgi:hypothetical protein